MPTQQEMHILTLIGGMKEAVKRSADASDSEDSVQQMTNHGNKLKKKAKFVHEGQLGLPNGPQVYKKTIEYNDYEREIITERPPLYDDDGYEIDSEDDDNGQALEAANEFYPYKDVKIEELLAPLTSVGDLPDHPSLSRAFTSKTLTELTAHARLMAQKEKKALWRMKHLLTKLSGDHTWIPTCMLETPADLSYFGDGKAEYREYLQQKSQAQHISVAQDAEIAETQVQDDTEMIEHDTAAEDGNPLPDPVVETVERELNRFTPAATPPQSAGAPAPSVLQGNNLEMGEAGQEASEQILPTETQETSASSVDGHAKPMEPTSTEPKPENETTEQQAEQPNSKPERPAPATEQAPKADKHQVATPTDTYKAVEPAPEAEQTEEHDPDTTLLDPEMAEEAPHSSKSPKNTSNVGDDTIVVDDNVEDKDKDVEKEGNEETKEDLEADTEEAPEPRRMRTRAQAQAVADDSAPSRQRSLSAASNVSFVHPYFLPPVTSIPGRDFMLPVQEAEETRKLLQLYIQKQEEIVRGAQKLYMGLLTADRMRASVMSWARAERHVGEMSDGEDWVDQQEWNLDDGLKKGHDEEEEEPAQTSKKTRTRRQ